MNAFDKAREVEEESMRILTPFLKKISLDGRFVLTTKGRLAKELQKTVGDALFNNQKGELRAIEIKAERENAWGNFFLETWSNKHRETPGWLHTLNTDLLFYHFIASDELYVMDFQKLKNWLLPKNILAYPEKRQTKYDQLNDTWGRCVPIKSVQYSIDARLFNPAKV